MRHRAAVFALSAGLLLAAEPPSRFAKLDGARVHYRVWGAGPQTVVLIHGWTCDMTFWREQIPALQAARRVIAIDLPGHGLSDKPEVAYTQDYFARAVDAVLSEVRVGKAVLAGHSMGGPVVRQFYRRFPEKTAALVMVDAFFQRPAQDEAQAAKRKADLDQRLAAYRRPDYREVVAKFVDFMFVDSTPAALRDEIKSKMLTAPQHVMASAQEGMFDPAVWKEDRVETPVLFIYAKRPFRPPDNEKYLRGMIPRLEYHELDGAGHFLMMEIPERFNRVLIDFLDRLR